MLKKSIVVAGLATLVVYSYSAHAEKADATKPLDYSAESGYADETKQVVHLETNVLITRGTMTIKGDKAILVKDPSGYQYFTIYAAAGSRTTFRQKRDGGPDLWIEGEAERIEYNDKTDVAKLISKAKMRRLEGAKPTDEMQGEFISYDSRAEFVSTLNSSSGANKPGGGRISGVIYPRADAGEPSDAKDNKESKEAKDVKDGK